MIFNNLTKGLVLTLGLSISLTVLNAQEYQKTKSGLKYKTIRSSVSAAKSKAGDMVILKMIYKSSKDSVLFDSRKNSEPFSYLVTEPAFPGDFNEALMLFGKGDSAIFNLDAESFYLKTLKNRSLPSFIKQGSELKFFIKVLTIKTNEEILKEQLAFMKTVNEKNDALKKQEADTLKKYLEDNKIDAKPVYSGLYYLPLVNGKGLFPVKGSTVVIKYTGSFLNGKVFDSNHESDMPLEFKMGAGQVIKGLEDGLMMMKVGGKAKLIIPSSLAYAENEAGEIKPFTTLVFDVELLEVK